MVLFGKKIEIGDDTILRRNPDLLFNEIDGEVVMLSIENGEYYGLDKVGSRIWQILENPITFGELITILIDEFEVGKQICQIETRVFIEELSSKNVINVIDLV